MVGKNTLAFVQAPEELRSPYEKALEGVFDQLLWFDSIESVAKSGKSFQAIIVDIDPLTEPFSDLLEKLRHEHPEADLVALSTSDSAQMALRCLRMGFCDFLLKPASPEEVVWALQRAQQQRELIQQLQDPHAKILKAVTQVSQCSTPTLARTLTLDHLMEFTQSLGAAWVKEDTSGTKILASVSKLRLPKFLKDPIGNKRIILKSKTSESRRAIFPCEDRRLGAVVLWGIPGKIAPQVLERAKVLIQHSEVSLQNLQRLEEIKQRTFVDDLTGLYNSRYLKFALTRCILRCRQPQQKFSVLFIDVDHFKKINDNNGHLVGSEFLVVIGKTVKNAVRKIDAVFRYGGDEFVVLLQDADQDGAQEIAERIRKNIERRVFVIQGIRLQTTVSVGIATYPDHATDREALLKLADEAMYCAKKTSRNAVHLAHGVGSKGNVG